MNNRIYTPDHARLHFHDRRAVPLRVINLTIGAVAFAAFMGCVWIAVGVASEFIG